MMHVDKKAKLMARYQNAIDRWQRQLAILKTLEPQMLYKIKLGESFKTHFGYLNPSSFSLTYPRVIIVASEEDLGPVFKSRSRSYLSLSYAGAWTPVSRSDLPLLMSCPFKSPELQKIISGTSKVKTSLTEEQQKL